MDTRLTNAVPHASPAPVRIASAPVGQSVETDLAIPAAVAAQAGAEKSRFGRKRHAEGEAEFAGKNHSHVDTDRETGDLVYKVIDPETRSVVSQYPYESLLRLRAYIRSVEDEASKG